MNQQLLFMVKNFKFILVFIVISILVFPVTIFARTSAEIAEEIKRQQSELNKTQSNLAKAQSDLQLFNENLANTKEGLPKVISEIELLEKEIEANKLELELIEQSRELKVLERQKQEISQSSSIRSVYMRWRLESTANVKELLNSFDFKKYEAYSSSLTNNQKDSIELISLSIDEINLEINNYENNLKQLDAKNEELQKKKSDLEAQINYYSSMIAYSGGQVSNLNGAVRNIQGNITGLAEEQRVAILREEEILRNNQGSLGNSECLKDPNAPAGTVYFCGNGRDLIMGHGVGMSQFGAKGAADQGWNATQILQFYYTGVQVVQYPLNSEITVKYCQNNPALDAYQDGSGGNTCNDGKAPITQRVSFDEYLSGLGEMPESWHPEARKAQIIAARTYAARYTSNGNPGIPICLTVYCQVSYFLNGDRSELSLVQSTKDLVITSGGALIDALYSADNNQGNGTSDSDTRFQDINGNGTYVSYLRAVNDNQFASSSRLYANSWCGSSPCGLWKWKTYSYSIQQINEMLNWINSSGLSQWVNDIGGLTSISFERDPSLRVKKVVLNGNLGSKKMGGWWFKYFWNEWVWSRGTYDYIYSQTFYLNSN